MDLILASESCDTSADIICAPDDVLELFEFKESLFSIGPFDFTRTVFLIFLATAIVLFVLWWGLRDRGSLVPTKFGAAVEALVNFVRNDIAIDIIGPEGARYAPYLLTIFMFILVGNLFEVTPFISFPITSRMAIPGFLALLTWLIFIVVGFAKNGLSYFTDTVWPKSVPVALRPLVGLIELVSIFILRPITLAVRLFANLVAGHLMLTLLLASGVIFIGDIADIGARSIIGIPWFAFGLGIYVFEIVVAVLQAYIFTLLSAVYVQTSVHPEH
ncbi:MAG: F0F1 ATP synthase subunit A [Acidimicrobiia bacterium]